MKKHYAFIKFDEVPQKPGKLTKVWRVVSTQDGTLLGGIKWFTNWRRYCFYPLPDMIFDENCLWDIADFCSSETTSQKQDQAARRAAR